MAMHTIACANHVHSRHVKAHLNLLFNAKGAMYNI